MRGTEVPINAEVLRWAIRESGFAASEVAAAAGVPTATLEAWLRGSERPKLTQFRKLAVKLGRPTATFFLPAPPPVEGAAIHFRRPQDAERSQLRPREIREVREARRIQRTLSWALRELGRPPVTVPSLTAKVSPVEAAGQAIVDLGVTPEVREKWRDPYSAQRSWREALEARGVLVFLLPLGKDAVRGFSLWDEYAPLVAANTWWNPEARIFSLLHEYGHLLTRSSSACLERSAHGNLVRPDDPIERWCERFAAAVLLPWTEVEAFLASIPGRTPDRKVTDLDEARSIAQAFKVSVTATVLRLIEAGVSEWDLFAQIPRRLDEKAGAGRGGKGRQRTRIREDAYGRRTSAVFLDAMDEDLISRSEVLNFLRVSDVGLEMLREATADQ